MDQTLRYARPAEHIYNKLKTIPRTGWVISGVSNPETVYDHTVSLIKLADSIAPETELSPREIDELKHILEIHDWAEATVGDEYLPNDNIDEYRIRKVAKAKRERAALEELLEDLPFKDTVLQLFQRYEEGSDQVAKLAKELDKYQALELALAYEEEQGIALFQEFDDYYKKDWPFSHPAILQRIKSLRTRHAAND